MRGRLILSTAVAIAGVVMIGAGPGSAQTGGGGGDGIALGGDQSAEGELLPGGDGAQVGAEFRTVTAEGGGGGGANRGGGGGSTTGITCRLTGSFGGFPTNLSLSVTALQSAYNTGGREPVVVYRTCFDGAGTIVSAEGTTWSPPVDGGVPVLVDPALLAEIARSRLVFPAPAVSTSPPADQGTYAQLATFFFMENWAPVEASAAAGPVTARVTATPLRQTWTIRDTYRGSSETVSCEGPGAAFNPSELLAAQLPPACGWTPVHSSAGQTPRGGVQAEACFPTTVTLTWGVRWSSTIGPGGALGEGTSSTDLCLVVAELQAVVVSEG
jgi:hypothetical protein